MPQEVITVFSIDGCPHCAKAKQWLQDAALGFTEINLSDYPECRGNMLKASEAFSVPQVFIGDVHLGDASATTALPHASLKDMVSTASPPTDARLQKPEYAPKPQPQPSPRTDAEISVDGTTVPLPEALHALHCTFKLFLSGKPAPRSSVESFLATRFKTDGAKLASELTSRDILSATPRGSLSLSSNLRNGPHLVLNRWRAWRERTDPPGVAIRSIKKAAGAAVAAFRSEAGVDYQAMGRSEELFHALELMCELRGASLASEALSVEAEKKAFLLNLYNTMVPLCFALFGIADSSLDRLNYFDVCAVDIGGSTYSLNQIESGLLRGNRKAPYHMSRPLDTGTAAGRQGEAAALQADPRIHFALNCGSKSCPPVKVYSPLSLEEELDLAAAWFCDSQDGIQVTPPSGVAVSQIFKWYHVDFGKTDAELVAFLVKHSRAGSVKRTQLEAASRSPKLSLSYLPYDWTTDASSAKPFKRSSCCCIL